jgi:FkbM family methyltransferase
MDLFKELNLEFRESRRYGGTWLWPASDEWGWRNMNKKPNGTLPLLISNEIEKKDLIIQAGGNCGFYPKYYSTVFKKVITFEPDPMNFFCLNYNVPEKNVYKFQACLGNDTVPLDIKEPGGLHLGVGSLSVSGEGDIPQLTIDSLNVNPDLIHLDVEGYEGFALLGAIETIKRSKPVIVLETNDRSNQYDWTTEKINELMKSFGYYIAVDLDHDKIYKPI